MKGSPQVPSDRPALEVPVLLLYIPLEYEPGKQEHIHFFLFRLRIIPIPTAFPVWTISQKLSKYPLFSLKLGKNPHNLTQKVDFPKENYPKFS